MVRGHTKIRYRRTDTGAVKGPVSREKSGLKVKVTPVQMERTQEPLMGYLLLKLLLNTTNPQAG